MRTYTFDCARDGDLFSEEFNCANRDDAEAAAVQAINAAWGRAIGTTYATWDDMAADMDGCEIIEHPAIMAPRIPLTMLDWLVGMAEEAILLREGDDEDEDPAATALHRESLIAAHAAIKSLTPPALPAPVSTADLIDAAACLWEAVLERHAAAKHDQIAVAVAFRAIGAAAMRHAVTSWAEAVHRDWEEAQRLNGYDDPFDWEFVPDWVALNVIFDANGAHLASVRKLPLMAEKSA